MKTLTIHLPDTLEATGSDLRILFAVKLYEQGLVSLGQGSEIAEISKKEFMEKLGSFKVSIFNFPSSDLIRDVRNA
jgi:predicted HTH domain antitoxin